MAASKQQKCALAFAAVCCMLFGGAIITCGFLFQFLDVYDDGAVNGMTAYEYYYTQYWLGIPLVVLGLLILVSLCCKARALLCLCIFLAALTLTLAITAVVLEGPKWRTWLKLQQSIDDNDRDDVNGICFHCNNTTCLSNMFKSLNLQDIPPALTLSCKEILYATVMQSIILGCSILAIVICQFVAFISIRSLGWMTQVINM